MTLPTDRAARHEAVAARFQDVVENVTDWDVPTPVGEWTARDLMRHLTQWAQGLITSGADVVWPDGPSVDEDPAGAFAHQTGVISAFLETPETAATPFTHEHMGTMPLGDVIERFYIPDVFMHTWDLARATGQDDTLDPETVEGMYQGMKSQEQMIRASGQFGDEQPVRDDASAQERFIAFIGRDPYWTPQA